MKTSKRLTGFIRRPSPEEVRELAASEHMMVSETELGQLSEAIDGALKLIDHLDDLTLPPEFMKPKYIEGRDPGYVPDESEDPHNAFIRKCHVQGAATGPLAGKRVGLKDNIRVAGIPMTNASRLVGSFVPSVDAIVVERLLDSGATIVGKLNMDDFSFAGTGETSVYGPTKNPANSDHVAGGSSSGAGAAVAAGQVDIAIGVDEGGSGRIPAAWCGVVGLKATHGLVPTFGLTYMDHTLDYPSPIAADVSTVALALQSIAGEDKRDPQCARGSIRVDDYSKQLDDGVDGLTIGVVQEAFGLDVSEEDVDRSVRQTIDMLGQEGAKVEKVSIGLWPSAWAIWNGFATHSISTMIESDLEGTSRRGLCDPDWQLAFGTARRTAGSFDPSPQLKVLMILGKYLRQQYSSTYFSKATNLRYLLTEQLDEALVRCDVLVTPTCPMKAFEMLTEPLEHRNFAVRSASMTQNTCPTNVTGHPSVSVRCGVGDRGLPIGFQIIGRDYEESTVLRVARAVEMVRT